MSFLNVRPCCITHPGELPGTPRGVMQGSEGGRTVARYIALPEGEVRDDKAVLILLYDIMGFRASNPKIIADTFADRLGIKVIVPDYIPNPPEPIWFNAVTETYPGQFAQKSWLDTARDWLTVFTKLVWKIPGFLDWSCVPLVRKTVEEARAEGYERIGAIGYCRGGSMVTQLLADGDKSPLTCGIVCHPGPEKGYEKITKPSMWHLASHDFMFKDKNIAELRQAMEGRGVVFRHTIYEDTMHGFAARPYLEQEASVKAFEEANTASIEFLREHLGVDGDK